MSIASLDAVVLDFGGILLELELERVKNELAALATDARRESLRHGALRDSAHAVETGELDPVAFRRALRDTLGTDADDAALDAAWCSIIGRLLPGTDALCRDLAGETRLFLLSNTNEIHHGSFMPMCDALFAPFHGLYFSHEMGLRKPDPRIFERVLDERSLAPERVVFVDDLEDNIAAARSLGMRTVLWPTNAGIAGLREAIDHAAAG